MPDLEDRLANWARVVRRHPHRGHAMSFEGRYRSPQPWHEIPATRYLGDPDYADAYRVEHAWATLPYLDRILLRGHYCLAIPQPRLCRTAKRLTGIDVPAHRYEQALTDAKLLLTAALERTEYENRAIVRVWARKVLALVGISSYSPNQQLENAA